MDGGMHTISPAVMMALALAASAALASLTWLVSLLKRDVSIVDCVWSLLIMVSALTYAFQVSGVASLTHPALILMIVWALRLSLHITLRGWGEPEDRRYRIIRARNQPNFAFKSLYLVFALQALLAWVVSFPLMAVADVGSAEPVSRWLFVSGLMAAMAGLVYEAVADWQLAIFALDAANHGKVMTRGLWRYSRHPNYFGEFIFWWGMFFAAIGSAGAGAAWTVLSPLLMSMLLLKVSGVPMLENGITERRPGYRAYVLGTNAFFPGASRLAGAGHD